MPSTSATIETEIDFNECGREPVHRPGAIQACGVLLVLEGRELRVAQVSDNTFTLLSRYPQELLGHPIDWLLEGPSLAALRDVVQAVVTLSDRKPIRCRLSMIGGPKPTILDAAVHRHDGRVILELEPAEADDTPAVTVSAPVLQAIAEGRSIYEMARLAAHEVSRLTGFDRVNAYRLFEDSSGEVIAEVRHPQFLPYLGLRFPAHDFPPQAQRLLHLQGIRTVSDMEGASARLITDGSAEQERPLDLSYAHLRAVSPFCVQYHRNIRVAATLTVGIEVDGRLWGFLSCHHGTAKRAAQATQSATLTVARTLGQAIQGTLARQRMVSRQRSADRVRQIRQLTDQAEDLPIRLIIDRPRLAGLVGSIAGVALVTGDRVFRRGNAPSSAEIVRLAAWVAERQAPDNVFATDCLSRAYPPAWAWRQAASGLLAGVVSQSPVTVVMCFRNELRFDVIWGGDPQHPVVRDEQNRLHPRGSFDRWRQSVEGRSRPWAAEDIAVMIELTRRLKESGCDDAARAAAVEAAIRGGEQWFQRETVLREEMLAAVSEYLVLTVRQAAGSEPVVVSVNNRLCDIFDLDMTEVVGSRLSEILPAIGLEPGFLLPGDDAPVDVDLWSNVIGLRTMRIIRETLAESHGPDQNARLILIRMQDITEFRRSNDALRAETERSQAAQRSLMQFLAQMSHELRSPLNAVIGFAEAIKSEIMGPIGTPAYLGFAHDIGQSGRHLLSLITDLLDLSKIEAGRRVIEEQPFNLTDTIEEVFRWIERQFEDKGQQWTLDRPHDDLLYKGEPGAIRQVVINILTNAGKYTPPGGQVHVRLIAPADGDVVLRIEDTGIGIKPEEVGRLFQPFARSADVRIAQIHGSGLGLAISKALVDLHGGRIELVSDGRSGTSVRVTLPAWRKLTTLTIDWDGMIGE